MSLTLTLDALRMRFGVHMRTEGTGGNCEALVGNLEGGYVLVVTDGNLGVDFGAEYLDGTEPNAGIYTRDAWEQGDDALANGEGANAVLAAQAAFTALAARKTTHAPCPDNAGYWFHKTTGACSCGKGHSL